MTACRNCTRRAHGRTGQNFDQLTAGRGRILAPYKVWIHSPTLASAWNTSARSSTTLVAVAREVEIASDHRKPLARGTMWWRRHIRKARWWVSRRNDRRDLQGADPKLTDPHDTRCIDTLHCSLPAANCRIRISVRSEKSCRAGMPKCSSCSAIIPQLRSP